MAMNAIEETFVKTFIVRDRRASWLQRLTSPKTRSKHLNHLAHTFHRDLDDRYLYDKDHLPAHIAQQVHSVLAQWTKSNPNHLCHIVAVRDERDGQMLPLEEAEADYLLTFGAIIILIPDTLAYYHPERSNLNQQPVYVLFHP